MCPIITLTLIGGGSTARMQRSVFITDWTQFRALFPVLVVSDEGGYTVVVLAVTCSVAACMWCGSSGLSPMGIKRKSLIGEVTASRLSVLADSFLYEPW